MNVSPTEEITRRWQFLVWAAFTISLGAPFYCPAQQKGPSEPWKHRRGEYTLLGFDPMQVKPISTETP